MTNRPVVPGHVAELQHALEEMGFRRLVARFLVTDADIAQLMIIQLQ